MALRISEDELVTLQARTGAACSVVTPSVTPKKNKYNAKKKEVDGIVFHSTAEAKRYVYLKELQRQGKISSLQVQYDMPFYYHENLMFTYVADFRYWQHNTWVIEDVKGQKTDVYRLKKKIIEAVYDCTIIEITRRK